MKYYTSRSPLRTWTAGPRTRVRSASCNTIPKKQQHKKDGRVCNGTTHTITYTAVKKAVQLTPNAAKAPLKTAIKTPSTTARKQKMSHKNSRDQTSHRFNEFEYQTLD